MGGGILWLIGLAFPPTWAWVIFIGIALVCVVLVLTKGTK